MKNKLVNYLLLFIAILPGFVLAQVVNNSPNTPSGYSIDAVTGNLVQNPTLTSGSNWTVSGMTGSYGADGYTFGYVSGTIDQTVNLNSVNFGYQNTSAVFATGIAYGFKYRFPCANQIGLTCETGTLQDNLNTTFTYTLPNGTVVTSIYHDLGAKNVSDGNPPYNPNWQQLAETYNFAAKPISQLGSAKLSITGMDAGFWACNPDCYGPQVKDAYVKVNYSVDPCILNPAYSVNCPGFSTVIENAKSPLQWNNFSIPNSLPHIGGGIQLHGYSYGFGYFAGEYCTAQFIICWSTSTANARNVTFNVTNSAGTSLFSDNWYVSGDNTGGSRKGRFLFTESRNSLTMGNVSWSVYGGYGDNMGFSGYVRPIWSPDPCHKNPLYNKNCSNYNAEIKRLADLENDKQEKIRASIISSITTITTTPNSTIETTIENPHTKDTKISVATEQTADKLLLYDQHPSKDKLDEKSNISNITELALGLISQNQQRENIIATQASEIAQQTAVAAASASILQAENIAIEAVTNSQSITQQQEQQLILENVGTSIKSDTNLNIVPVPGSTSVVNQTIQQKNIQSQIAADTVSQITNTSSTSTIVQFNAMSETVMQRQIIPDIVPQTTNTSSTSTIVQFNAMSEAVIQAVQQFNILQPPMFSQVTPVVVAPYQSPVIQGASETKQFEVFQPNQQASAVSISRDILQVPQQHVNIDQKSTIQSIIIAPLITVDIPIQQANITTDRTNPINDIIENKQLIIEQENKDNNIQQVKSNVQDNDAAAGVSITNIARTPVGFNTYMIALSDANFYASKEIYRNQKTVDNVRALRQLASDKLHQEMVDQQYRK